jgi:predicted ABC-type ATPase
LIFFWLPSPDDAKLRVKERVAHGGHNIPEEVIERRYKRGIENFFTMYAPVCHQWIMVNNSIKPNEVVAKGQLTEIIEIKNTDIWDTIKQQSHGLTTGNRRLFR